ncbi:MAG: MBL fold metallo-hydrolase [Lachnospiraceae bacterium]|nr:MBL fold metallo-hydrolase [Lachnospiraceae bacterium]
MRLLSIASGSSGNCIYIGDDTTHILIDAGVSGKRIEAGLNAVGVSGKDLDAVLVTHEHSDHIGGLGVLARKFDVPIYSTRGTIAGISMSKSVGDIDGQLFQAIRRNENIAIGSLIIQAIPVSHDAAEPVCYKVSNEASTVAVATDMGYYTPDLVEQLKGLDAILLEANHDVNMVQVGPYPYYLKQRILGKKGHLSNESAGRLLSEIVHDDLKHVFLGHLSRENNLPQLAHEAVRLEITMGDNPYQASDFDIRVAERSEPSGLIEV